MELKLFTADVLGAERIKKLCQTSPVISYKKVFDNKRLVDTAGFVPLDVRIKQFLISGEQAKLSSEMFDSDDWRFMYENINDNNLEVGDDIEDVSRKLNIVMARQRELLSRKAAEVVADTPDQTSEKKQSDKKASAESVTDTKPKSE